MHMSRREFLSGTAAFAALPAFSVFAGRTTSAAVRRSEERQRELIDMWDGATGLVKPEDYVPTFGFSSPCPVLTLQTRCAGSNQSVLCSGICGNWATPSARGGRTNGTSTAPCPRRSRSAAMCRSLSGATGLFRKENHGRENYRKRCSEVRICIVRACRRNCRHSTIPPTSRATPTRTCSR